MALPAELQKASALLAALRQVKAMPSGRGKRFPASGPFAPAGRHRRAQKPTGRFTDGLSRKDCKFFATDKINCA